MGNFWTDIEKQKHGYVISISNRTRYEKTKIPHMDKLK